MMKRHCIGLSIIFLALGGVNALDATKVNPAKLERHTFSEPHMGTIFRLVLYAPDAKTAENAARAAFARIAELNAILSDYQADSELMKLCAKAGGDPVEVSADLFAVLKKAQEVAKLSDGAFDVSVSPVVRLWRKARKTKKLPDAAEIKKALELVDYRNIKLDEKRRTVQLLLIGMLLDLGGLAKGYTADAVLEVLRKHGVTRALVAAGGDVAVADPPPDAPGWKIGIAPLRDPQGDPTHYVMLKNAAVSTAGDTHQFVEVDGKRYSHIIDPKTGIGLVGRRAVTVIAPTGLIADALDTAACVLGPERGMKLIEAEGVAGVFVYESANEEKTIQSRRFPTYEWKSR